MKFSFLELIKICAIFLDAPLSVMPFSEIDVMCFIKCIMKCRECHAIQ